MYSDIGNSLGSDAITHAVLKSLKIIEDEIPPPGKAKGNLNYLSELGLLKCDHCSESEKCKSITFIDVG